MARTSTTTFTATNWERKPSRKDLTSIVSSLNPWPQTKRSTCTLACGRGFNDQAREVFRGL